MLVSKRSKLIFFGFATKKKSEMFPVIIHHLCNRKAGNITPDLFNSNYSMVQIRSFLEFGPHDSLDLKPRYPP
jgi:hypothetical protein